MAYFYFSAKIEDGKSLVLAPMSSRKAPLCSEPLQDESGYFLYEQADDGENGEIHVLAQVHSDEAALRLSRMFNMS